MNASQIERRSTTRHRSKTVAYVRTSTGVSKAACSNLSAFGCGISGMTLPNRPRIGDVVQITFAINVGVIKLHVRKAVISHITNGVYGMRMEPYTAR